MAKGSKAKGREKFRGKNSNKVEKVEKVTFGEDDLDDEIDAFHKQRDVVPLDASEDEVANSEDEMDHAVFDIEAHDDSDEEEEEEEEVQEEEVEIKDKNYLAMVRQQKFMRQKFPVSDQVPDDEDDEIEEEGKKAKWGKSKNMYYNADNAYEPGSSDEEQLKEEEYEVVKIQKKKAESLTMGDFGLADDVFSDSDGPKHAFQDAFSGKRTEKHKVDALDAEEEVKKDISILSKEEQMEVVNSSAPELVGLLSELDKAVNQLEEVKLHLSWAVEVKKRDSKGLTNYLEVKQTLLLSYCQAISFYLLLKSEGQSIRDHPVISRLVEIKNLLEKMEQIDTNLNLSSQIEDFASNRAENENGNENGVPMELETNMGATPESSESIDMNDAPESAEGKSFSEELVSKISNSNQEMGLQSIEMLKLKANLEEKLKKKGMYNSSDPNSKGTKSHAIKPANTRLETLDDFDDDVHMNGKHGSQMNISSKLVATKVKKPKFVSGDDDLPKRDDIGERRKKFEMRVLTRARAGSDDDNIVENEGEGEDAMLTNPSIENEGADSLEPEDEFYKQVKKKRTDKLTAKAQVYSRDPAIAAPELEVEDEEKRQISYQMETNRGLTRSRKKLLKNPRKKYKIKHQKAVIRRKGQVQDIRKPAGPYGGEATGVNVNVSRSIRFKN